MNLLTTLAFYSMPNYGTPQSRNSKICAIFACSENQAFGYLVLKTKGWRSVFRAMGFESYKSYLREYPGMLKIGSEIENILLVPYKDESYNKINTEEIFYCAGSNAQLGRASFFKDLVSDGCENIILCPTIKEVRGCVGFTKGRVSDSELWFCSDWKED